MEGYVDYNYKAIYDDPLITVTPRTIKGNATLAEEGHVHLTGPATLEFDVIKPFYKLTVIDDATGNVIDEFNCAYKSSVDNMIKIPYGYDAVDVLSGHYSMPPHDTTIRVRFVK